MTASDRDLHDAIEIIAAVAQALKELGTVMDYELRTHLKGLLSDEQYTTVIERLTAAKLIRREGYLLTWVGGEE